jgi:hypothetical protein
MKVNAQRELRISLQQNSGAARFSALAGTGELPGLPVRSAAKIGRCAVASFRYEFPPKE